MELSLEKARELTEKYLKDSNNRNHSRESEVVLAALAKKLGEDEEKWGMAGLLHDLDWEETEEWPEQHGLRTVEILQEEGYEVPSETLHAIKAHNFFYTGVQRESKLDFALAAGESVTGLIYAYALMRPEGISGMKASSLNKKFKDKSFAAKVPREVIGDIVKVGIELSEFFVISIEAMAGIAGEIGV
ncbi:HD domain-containing protein [Patescibacteria group bacterium]|nr:HD domain-containing protein [Patescibacteria group bacterium]